MNTLKKTLVACALLILGAMTRPLSMNAQFAQLVDTGTVIPDISFTDINNNKFRLYEYLDQGYTVVIELALTTCPVCFAYKREGSFERLYQNYGPNGSIAPKKILPIFVEFGTNTNDADLRGTGQRTQGDWVSGSSYPIVDPATAEEIDDILYPFFDYTSGSVRSISTPTFLMICPDRKLIVAEEGLYNAHDYKIVDKVETGCAVGNPSNISDLLFTESVRIFPNPVEGELTINLETKSATKATFLVTDVFGKNIINELVELDRGNQARTLNIGMLTSGIYIFSVTTDHGTIQKKFVKK